MNITARIIYLCVLLFLVSSCSDNKQFVLKGELYNKKEKQIYLVFDDPIAKIDTIKPVNGKFEYTFNPDTITLMRLVNDSGIAIPIFADKKWIVSIKGSFSSPEVTGNGPNSELQKFRKEISLLNDSSLIRKKAEEFITNNRKSYASAYILNEYLIQETKPDIEQLDNIISGLDGHIKDCRIVDIIQKSISENKNTKSEYINYFSCKDRNGKYISWSSKEEEYTLINFWASWNGKSIVLRDSLYDNIKILPKEKFRVLNMSLDYDKKEWERNCKKDNEQWIETCDFKAWQNSIIKQLKIENIPYSVLLTKNRKIITTCIYGKELIKKVETLIKEEKDKK